MPPMAFCRINARVCNSILIEFDAGGLAKVTWETAGERVQAGNSMLVKLAFWLFLLCADATRFDFRPRIVLALDWPSGNSAQHC